MLIDGSVRAGESANKEYCVPADRHRVASLCANSVEMGCVRFRSMSLRARKICKGSFSTDFRQSPNSASSTSSGTFHEGADFESLLSYFPRGCLMNKFFQTTI